MDCWKVLIIFRLMFNEFTYFLPPPALPGGGERTIAPGTSPPAVNSCLLISLFSLHTCVFSTSLKHIFTVTFTRFFFFFKFLNMYYYSVVNTKSSENQVLDFWIAGKSCWCWGKKSKPETCSETCLETCQVTCWRMHAPCPCPLSSCTT